MLGRTDRRRRLVVLIALFAVVAVALGVRLSYWQVARGPELRALAKAQVERPAEEVPQRGRILDRRGTVLATTAYRDVLAAYPDRVTPERRGELSRQLSEILGPEGPTQQEIFDQLDPERQYVVVARRLSEDQSEAVRALPSELTQSLGLEPKAVRFYPNPGGAPGTTLASQLLGFVNQAGEGHYGIEQKYDQALAGRPRVVAALRDVAGTALTSSERVIDPGEAGTDIQLTIDASLQLQLEKELYAAWVADQARRVSAVILDPYTGELLASASVPGYDANDYAATARVDPSLFQDPIISQVYEPGSTMKMFTAAAALGSGTATPETIINDTGGLQLGRIAVHNADRRGMGPLAFEDVIAYSRNVGTAKAAMNLGETVHDASEVLYETWTRLGVGTRTGIDLSNEVAGLVSNPEQTPWQPIDLANRAFGQGVALTQIQLARSFSAMVNGGMLVSPHVAQTVGAQAVSVDSPQHVLAPELSGQLRDMMTHVVTAVPWYAEGTLIPRYWVGGKTGTAQIWDNQRGAWVWNTFNFTFAGFVGAERPEAVIVTRIHETQPHVRGQGDLDLSITSYELFRRVARDTISALDLRPLPQTPKSAPSPTPDPSPEPGESEEPRPIVEGGPGSWGTNGRTTEVAPEPTPSPRPTLSEESPASTSGSDAPGR